MGGTAATIRRRIRSAWRFFIDTVEWTSNGARRRPPFAERSDIYDPSAGWGPPDDTTRETLDSERTGTREP